MLTFARAVMTAFGFGFAPAASATIGVGDSAPNFSLPDQHGLRIDLEHRRGRGWTIVYFQPFADRVARLQGLSFGAVLDHLHAEDVEVIGISAAPAKASSTLASRAGLEYPLLHDVDGGVAKAYGVLRYGPGTTRRMTFIIDENFVVRYVDRHPDPAFDGEWCAEVLRELAASNQ